MGNKIELYGFNNLTKALSFNMYNVCCAETVEEQRRYVAGINARYNSERLAGILHAVADGIGAQVLNVSRQDYHPQGASVTFLIAEEPVETVPGSGAGEVLLGHLDKSHITVHTYPECHPGSAAATFRADVDVSTCGEISPLGALDYLIGCFGPDIATMDYRVRGFTRDASGVKLFMDHPITSIREFIAPEILSRYDAIDINNAKCNLFHTRLLIKEMDPRLRREMTEIYSGANLNE